MKKALQVAMFSLFTVIFVLVSMHRREILHLPWGHRRRMLGGGG